MKARYAMNLMKRTLGSGFSLRLIESNTITAGGRKSGEKESSELHCGSLEIKCFDIGSL